MAKLSENWLSTVDLGTYHLTLYMVSSAISNDPSPLKNDASISEKDAIIIAESGVTGGYTIDNVLMRSALVGASSTGGMATGIIQFDLHEPLAFKLLDRILSYTGNFGWQTMQSAQYVLKIEFLGRDHRTDRVKRYPGVHLYTLTIQSVDAKVTTRGTMYNIVAATRTTTAIQKAVVETTISVNDIETMRDFIKNLESTLNDVYVPRLRAQPAHGNSGNSSFRYRIEIDEQGARSGALQKLLQTPEAINKIVPFPTSVVDSLWGGLRSEKQPSPAETHGVEKKLTEDLAPGNNIVEFIKQKVQANVPAFVEWQETKKPDPITPTPIVQVISTTEVTEDADALTGEPITEIIFIVTTSQEYSDIEKSYADQQSKLRNAGVQRARFDSLPIRKKYTYLYSGENTEVLDFEIHFNMMFAAAKYPIDGKLYPTATQMVTGSKTEEGPISTPQSVPPLPPNFVMESSRNKPKTIDDFAVDIPTFDELYQESQARGIVQNYNDNGLAPPVVNPSDITSFYAPINALERELNPTIYEQFPPSQASPGYGAVRYLEDLNVSTGRSYVESINYNYVSMNPALLRITEMTTPELAGATIDSIRLAELHNRASNGLQAELSIKGDPFWLGTPGAVLDTAPSSGSSVDAAIVDSTSEESLQKYLYHGGVLIALATYNPDENIAQPDKPFGKEMDMVSSGVYRVVIVESRFAGGEFTQQLTCQREINTAVALVANQLDQL